MLVLSRKPGEQVVIGANVRLTVLAIRGNSVRLGFTAPAGVLIHREELRWSPDDLGRSPGSVATSEEEP